MAERGKFFAIEGGDGSGKGTQTKLLTDSLRAEGYEIYPVSFPRYGNRSAQTAEMYLRGEFGGVNEVSPYLASAAFTLDRVAEGHALNQWLLAHPDGIALADRYVLSNAAHQGTKISDYEERKAFYDYTFGLEFDDLHLPKPDKSVTFLVPSDVAQANVDKKAARTYTSEKRDIHEKDLDHLSLATRNYHEIATLYPELTTAIKPYDDARGQMRDERAILAEIRALFDI